FMVAPEWQGLGLGSALQARLQEYAIRRGVRGFIAEILPKNQPMQCLAMRAQGSITTVRDEDTVHVTIILAAEPPHRDVGGQRPTTPSAQALSSPTGGGLKHRDAPLNVVTFEKLLQRGTCHAATDAAPC